MPVASVLASGTNRGKSLWRDQRFWHAGVARRLQFHAGVAVAVFVIPGSWNYCVGRNGRNTRGCLDRGFYIGRIHGEIGFIKRIIVSSEGTIVFSKRVMITTKPNTRLSINRGSDRISDQRG